MEGSKKAKDGSTKIPVDSNEDLTNETKNDEHNQVMHNFSSESHSFMNKKITLLFLFLFILGIITGNILFNMKDKLGVSGIGIGGVTSSLGSTQGSSKNEIVGSSDEKTFKDIAEGILKEGGVDGEGAYHLERTGGESQNVYLTSSIVDLSKYIGKKVKVWGQTNSAKVAGWLMDVGRLQVLE